MTEIFNMLVQTLKDNLSEECTVTSAIVRKNNNTKHYSISIRKDEEPTVPTLYVDDILEDIGDSKISIWDGIKKILVRYNDARKLTPKFADLKILSDKSYILKHVYYQLINATANKELLSTVPHKKFLDLAVIFRVTVDEAQDTLESDFGIDEKNSEKLAEAAYEKYAEGDGKTEYECIEWAANHSVEIL